MVGSVLVSRGGSIPVSVKARKIATPKFACSVVRDTLAIGYVATYVERDVRQVLNVQDLSVFQRFLRLCAGRTGQLLNSSALAGETGVSHSTARAWLSVLESSDVVFLLPPYHRNFGKRLVKTPKLYFLTRVWRAGCWVSATRRRWHSIRYAVSCSRR